jgi:hypothetical protein
VIFTRAQGRAVLLICSRQRHNSIGLRFDV